MPGLKTLITIAYREPVRYIGINLPNHLDPFLQNRDSLGGQEVALRKTIQLLLVPVGLLSEGDSNVPIAQDTLAVTNPYSSHTAQT